MPTHLTDLAVSVGHQVDTVDRQERGINVYSAQSSRLSRANVILGDRQFQLMDIEAGGFSVSIPAGSQLPAVGDSVDWAICVDDQATFFGCAVVGASCARRSGTVLRLTTKSNLPTPALIEAHQSLADLRGRSASATSLVPPQYKALCADIVARLREYRRLAYKLDDQASSDSESVKDIFEAAAGKMASDWKVFSEQAAESVAPYLQDAEMVDELRTFTQRLVTPELTEGAIWRRAFEKPRGYPGDYGVMNYCYAPQQIGATSYARLCHRLGLNFVECVRTRKNVVREVIRERLEQCSTVSAMSIACGSAHEIFELASGGDIVNRLQATLVDQDAEALNFAMDRLLPYLSSDDPRLTATTVRAQFGDYSDPIGGALPAGQDLVYCFGMFDYLPHDLVAGIVPVLYSKLKPGGTMIVGNLLPAPEMIWPLCFVLGYDMWFRTAGEMLSLAVPLSECRAELKVESTGYNYLLFLHRQ